MTVNISKPSINIREKLSELDKPSGIAGEAVLRADSVQDVRDQISAGRKNLIINGGMQVWQRGTTTTGGGGYRADMFALEPRSGTTVHMDRSVDVPSGYGFSHSARLYATASTDDGFHFKTGVELDDVGNYGIFEAGATFTLSFWIKSAYAGRNINPVLYLSHGVLTSSNISQSVTSTQGSTNAIPTVWTKMVFNYTIPTWAAATGSLTSVRALGIRNLIGINDTPQDLYITGCQLERGSVATDFEHRSYGEELALCQRYYQTITNGELWGSTNTTTRMRINARLSPDMRTSPTISRVAGTSVTFQGSATGKASANTSPAQGAASNPRALGFDLGGFTSLGDRAYAGANGTVVVFTASAEL